MAASNVFSQGVGQVQQDARNISAQYDKNGVGGAVGASLVGLGHLGVSAGRVVGEPAMDALNAAGGGISNFIGNVGRGAGLVGDKVVAVPGQVYPDFNDPDARAAPAATPAVAAPAPAAAAASLAGVTAPAAAAPAAAPQRLEGGHQIGNQYLHPSTHSLQDFVKATEGMTNQQLEALRTHSPPAATRTGQARAATAQYGYSNSLDAQADAFEKAGQHDKALLARKAASDARSPLMGGNYGFAAGMPTGL